MVYISALGQQEVAVPTQLRQSKHPPTSAFSFSAGPQLIGYGPPTLWRAICLTQCTDSNACLIQKPGNAQKQYLTSDVGILGPVTLTPETEHLSAIRAWWRLGCAVRGSWDTSQRLLACVFSDPLRFGFTAAVHLRAPDSYAPRLNGT